jgi:hypothetical protein
VCGVRDRLLVVVARLLVLCRCCGFKAEEEDPPLNKPALLPVSLSAILTQTTNIKSNQYGDLHGRRTSVLG